MGTRDICAYHWFPRSHVALDRDRVLRMMLKTSSISGNPPRGELPLVMKAAGFDRARMDISASTKVISSAEGKAWFGEAISAWSVGAGQRLTADGVAEDQLNRLRRWFRGG